MKRQLTIGSEIRTVHGHFKLLDKIKCNNRSYLYKLKCNNCGYEFTTRFINRCICNECRKSKTINKYVGLKTDVYEILEFIEKKKHTLFYRVRCLKCNKQSIKSLRTIMVVKDNCEFCRQGNYRIPTINAPINCIKGQYIRGAMERNFEWNLNDNEFKNLISQSCYYCGAAPKQYKQDLRFNKSNIPFLRNGIDRLDSNKGYIIDNCVPCCENCNRMKMQLSENEFLTRVEKIYNYAVLKRSQTIPIGSTSQVNGDGNGVPLTVIAEGEEIVEST